MPQSFASVHLHIVFSTKHREETILVDFKDRLYSYIGGIVDNHKCKLICAGGMPDHSHLLVSLGRTLSIADLVKDIKGSSSAWIHKNFKGSASFSWQAGYGAFGVSFRDLAKVGGYIANQEIHHAKTTFQDEFRDFLRQHDIEWDEKYVWD